MDAVSGLGFVFGQEGSFDAAEMDFSVLEAPVIGNSKLKRITSTCKMKSDGSLVSVLVEEYHGSMLQTRYFQQYKPVALVCKELYERDGSLLSSETERQEDDSSLTRIILRGSGKSSTTRIIRSEIEVRANERLVMIETPLANYNFHIYEGKWSSYYKAIDLRLELKANFLRSPDDVLKGPDGIDLVFRKGRLVDLRVKGQLHGPAISSEQSTMPQIPGIID